MRFWDDFEAILDRIVRHGQVPERKEQAGEAGRVYGQVGEDGHGGEALRKEWGAF
jgi:hypothetical protein